jgi:phage terminase small subunit
MPRMRDPIREKAFLIYKSHNGYIDLVEIAGQLSRPSGTIRGWKSKDKWDDKLNGTFQKNTERSKQNKNTTKPIADEVKQVIENPELNDKQRLFCLHFINSLNATKAYQKAYECSYKTAAVEAHRLLKNPKIINQINELRKGIFSRALLTVDDIVQRYIDIAFADITDFADFGTRKVVFTKENDNGTMSATVEMSYVDAKPSWMVDGALLSEISMGKGGIKIKLQDRIKALQWLTDHMDLLTTEQKIRVQHMQNRDKLECDRFEHQKNQDERNNF